MASLRTQIGPLASVFAFEAAARLGSFTAAARELGVTQAAVSKQISLLEERLGASLFTRRHRHVELTPAGQRLYTSTSEALLSIANTMRDVGKSEHRPLVVTLSASLSRFWLMPRMADFRRQHPEIALRIVAQDELDDIKPNGADLLIRYGPGSWEDPTAIRLFSARVVAMASPDYLARHPIRNVDDVTTAALIAYDTPGREWVSWSDWARIALPGRSLPLPELSVSRYHDAILAAQQSQGIVLVWNVSDEPNLGAEDLVPIPGPEIRTSGIFYLVPLTSARQETKSVIDWFQRQCAHQIT